METIKDLAAESLVYKVLSRMYEAPKDIQILRDLGASLRPAVADLESEPIAGALAAISDYLMALSDVTDLAKEYVRLFRGPVRALVHPCESMYVEGELMGESTLAVVQLYRDAGLIVTETWKDLPDHISSELEFMHFLLTMEYKQLIERDNSASEHISSIKNRFMEDHLIKWVPQFAAKVIDVSVSPYYRALAIATRELISSRRSAAGSCSLP